MKKSILKIIFIFVIILVPSYANAICPTTEDNITYTDITSWYSNNDNMDFNLDTKTGLFTMQLKDVTEGKVDIRMVPGKLDEGVLKHALNETNKNKSELDSTQFLTANKDGNFYISELKSDDIFYLEFYLKKSSNVSCNGILIEKIKVNVPNKNTFLVANPAKTNPAAYGCDVLLNMLPNYTLGADTNIVNNDIPGSTKQIKLGEPQRVYYFLDQDDDICGSSKLGHNNYVPNSRETAVCIGTKKNGANGAECNGVWVNSYNNSGGANGYDIYYDHGKKVSLYNNKCDGTIIEKQIGLVKKEFCVKCPDNKKPQPLDNDYRNIYGFKCVNPNTSYEPSRDPISVSEIEGMKYEKGFSVQCYNTNVVKKNAQKTLCPDIWSYDSKNKKCVYNYTPGFTEGENVEKTIRAYMKGKTSVTNFDINCDNPVYFGEDGEVLMAKCLLSIEPSCKCPDLKRSGSLIVRAEENLDPNTGLCRYTTSDRISSLSRDNSITKTTQVVDYYRKLNSNLKGFFGGCSQRGDEFNCTFYAATTSCTYKTKNKTTPGSSTSASTGSVSADWDVLKKTLGYYCVADEIPFEDLPDLKRRITSETETIDTLCLGPDCFKKAEGAIDSICNNPETVGVTESYTSPNAYWKMVCEDGFSAVGDTAKLVAAGGGFAYRAFFTLHKICIIKNIDYYNGVQRNPTYARPNCLECEREVCDDGCNDKCNGDEGPYDCGCHSEKGKSCSEKVIEKYKCPSNCEENAVEKFNGRIAAIKDDLVNLLAMVTENISPGKYSYEIIDSYVPNGSGTQAYVVSSDADPNVIVNHISKKLKYSEESFELYDGKCEDVSTSAGLAKCGGSSQSQLVENFEIWFQSDIKLPVGILNKTTGIAYYTNNADGTGTKFGLIADRESLGRTAEADKAFYYRSYYPIQGGRYYTSVDSKNFNVVYNDGYVSLGQPTKYNIRVKAEGINANEGHSFSSNIQCFYGVYNKVETPPPGTRYCIVEGEKYYDKNGNEVSKEDYLKSCHNSELYCKKDAGGNLRGRFGQICDQATFDYECTGVCTGHNVTYPINSKDGLPWIFRVIDNRDVFPNDRAPRFNWSSGAYQSKEASLYNGPVDPVKTTQKIEEKGNGVYTKEGEVDYSFKLTRQNIKNIREYNSAVDDLNRDGSKNYLDYDMNCTTRTDIYNREVCISNFLNNEYGEFITYANGYSVDNRKKISVCNNAKGNGTECDD